MASKDENLLDIKYFFIDAQLATINDEQFYLFSLDKLKNSQTYPKFKSHDDGNKSFFVMPSINLDLNRFDYDFPKAITTRTRVLLKRDPNYNSNKKILVEMDFPFDEIPHLFLIKNEKNIGQIIGNPVHLGGWVIPTKNGDDISNEDISNESYIGIKKDDIDSDRFICYSDEEIKAKAYNNNLNIIIYNKNEGKLNVSKKKLSITNLNSAPSTSMMSRFFSR